MDRAPGHRGLGTDSREFLELFHLMTQPLKHTSPPGAPLWQLVPISTHETPGEGAVSLQLSITALQPGPQASENHCGFPPTFGICI